MHSKMHRVQLLDFQQSPVLPYVAAFVEQEEASVELPVMEDTPQRRPTATEVTVGTWCGDTESVICKIDATNATPMVS